jgi:hypothetical protein
MISAVENEKNKARIKDQFFASKANITALVGLSKNAGKTSFLNWLSSEVTSSEIGIITTGRDGEDFDLISKQQKPKVFIPANSFFSTWASQIQKKSPFLLVVEKLPYKAAGKQLWLVKTAKKMWAEVVGPASVFEQIQLAKIILSKGAKHVFIDGSLDRKSIVLAPETEQFFLVISPVYGSLEKIIKETERVINLTSIPRDESIELFPKITYHNGKECKSTEYKTLLGNETEIATLISTEKKIKWIFAAGVITEKMVPKIKPLLQKYNCSLHIEHPFQLQVSTKTLDELAGKIFVKRQTRLCGIAVNSFSADGNHLDRQEFFATIQNLAKTIPVVDIYSL